MNLERTEDKLMIHSRKNCMGWRISGKSFPIF